MSQYHLYIMKVCLLPLLASRLIKICTYFETEVQATRTETKRPKKKGGLIFSENTTYLKQIKKMWGISTQGQ